MPPLPKSRRERLRSSALLELSRFSPPEERAPLFSIPLSSGPSGNQSIELCISKRWKDLSHHLERCALSKTPHTIWNECWPRHVYRQTVEISWEQAYLSASGQCAWRCVVCSGDTNGLRGLAALHGSREYVYRHAGQVLSSQEQAVLIPLLSDSAGMRPPTPHGCCLRGLDVSLCLPQPCQPSVASSHASVTMQDTLPVSVILPVQLLCTRLFRSSLFPRRKGLPGALERAAARHRPPLFWSRVSILVRRSSATRPVTQACAPSRLDQLRVARTTRSHDDVFLRSLRPQQAPLPLLCRDSSQMAGISRVCIGPSNSRALF